MGEVEVTVSKIDAVREYVLEYVTGVLWLLALAAWYVLSGQSGALRSSLRSVGDALPVGEGSQFFTAFLLLIGGVIVPYAVAMAFRPVTWIVMNVTIGTHFVLLKKILRRDPIDTELRRGASAVLKSVLGISGEPTTDMFRLYLASADPEVARRVQHEFDHVRFHSLSLLPASLFLALLAQLIVADALGCSALVVFGALFVAGARASNRALWIHNNVVEMAVILVATRRGEATPPVAVD